MVALRALLREEPATPPLAIDRSAGIAALEQRWRATCVDLDALAGRGDLASDHAFRSLLLRERALAEAILSCPAASMTDLAAKARIVERGRGEDELAALALAADVARLAR